MNQLIEQSKQTPEYLALYADLKERILLDIQVEEIESSFKRNVVTDRIVINCLQGILKVTGNYPKASFVSEDDGALSLLFVLDNANANDIDAVYAILPQYQDLAILHESRDFSWQVALDNGLDFEFIRHDFDTVWTRIK